MSVWTALVLGILWQDELVEEVPWTSHMWRIWGVKFPHSTLIIEKGFQSSVFNTNCWNSEFFCSAYERDKKIRQPNAWSWHFLHEFVLSLGGRLKHSNLSLGEKHPILIPGSHAIAKLLVSYYHELVRHQWRHITEGKVRSAGDKKIRQPNAWSWHFLHEFVLSQYPKDQSSPHRHK
jgi:hypothetical protein